MKSCLVVLRNKKIFSERAEYYSCLRAFAAEGLYFDKIAVVAYDGSAEITSQLRDCRENFNVSVVLCPQTMESTLKGFLQPLYGGTFDMSHALETGERSVYLVFSERPDFVTPAKHIALKSGRKFAKAYIKAVGAPHEEILAAVREAKTLSPTIECNVYESYSDCTIEVVYSESDSKMKVDGAIRAFVSALGGYIYALEDISLAERLFQLLRLRRMKISCAESFTGGGIGKRLVDVPGISEVYFEGLNTYSNESKAARLGVDEMTIRSKGAVSAETAFEMAEGLIKQGNCDVSVTTTGIAGPKSDNTSKPVGLCYIAVGLKEGVNVYKFNIAGDRKTVTETAINNALFLVYKNIK